VGAAGGGKRRAGEPRRVRRPVLVDRWTLVLPRRRGGAGGWRRRERKRFALPRVVVAAAAVEVVWLCERSGRRVSSFVRLLAAQPVRAPHGVVVVSPQVGRGQVSSRKKLAEPARPRRPLIPTPGRARWTCIQVSCSLVGWCCCHVPPPAGRLARPPHPRRIAGPRTGGT